MGKPPHGICQLVSMFKVAMLLCYLYEHSADYVQGTRITFKSKEDAVHFAEKQGMLVMFPLHNGANLSLQAGTIMCMFSCHM